MAIGRLLQAGRGGGKVLGKEAGDGDRLPIALPIFVAATRARGDERSAVLDAQAVVAHDGMVVAQEARAAQIGADVLKRGGNAIDAAAAVGFALAVSYPRAGNIGGGGFMVIHLVDGTDTTIDYRETAPAAITAQSFLDESGNADPDKSRDSALAIGVPGTVAGLALAEQKYGSGKFTLAELIAPAIAMARDGIAVTDDTADSLPNVRARLSRWPASAKIFFKADAAALGPGDRLVQSDLADTLETIAHEGPRAFYEGPIAQKIAAAVQAAGGVITADDLKSYQAIERPPVRGSYRGYDVISTAPPSSGGVELVEMLNILEGYDLGGIARANAAQGLHLMIEAMKRAYADRALFLGDPDRVANPVSLLTSKNYAAGWRAGIDPVRATAAADIRAGEVVRPEGRNTTHFPSSTASAMRSPIPIRLISATALGWSPRARGSFSTTSSTISPPKPMCPTPMVWSAPRPMRPAPANGRCRR